MSYHFFTCKKCCIYMTMHVYDMYKSRPVESITSKRSSGNAMLQSSKDLFDKNNAITNLGELNLPRRSHPTFALETASEHTHAKQNNNSPYIICNWD